MDTTTDDSVVVGLACRVPGAMNPAKLWQNILHQQDLRKKMPADRFNVETFYHPDGARKGTTNAKYGYFLDQDISQFDAGFFNISGKEAEAMDPQQRILLEVVYEALEDGKSISKRACRIDRLTLIQPASPWSRSTGLELPCIVAALPTTTMP